MQGLQHTNSKACRQLNARRRGGLPEMLRHLYDVESVDKNEICCYLRKAKYTCQSCGTENWVGTHRVVDGEILECEKCSKKATIKQKFVMIYA